MEGRLKTEAEIAVPLPQAKETQKPLGIGRNKEGFSLESLQRECGPAKTFI